MKWFITILFISGYSTAFQLFSIFGYGFTAYDFFICILILIIGFKFIWSGYELNIPKNAFIYFFFIFGLSVLVSGLRFFESNNTDFIFQYIKTASHLYLYMLFCLICFVIPVKSDTWDNIIKVFLAISLLVNIFAIYQIFARAFNLPLAWLNYNNISLIGRGFMEDIDEFSQLSLKFGNFFRATSFFSEPSSLAQYNLFVLVFTLIPFVQKESPFFKNKTLTLSIFITALITLMLTYSLTGFLGLVLLLSAVFLLEKVKRIKALVITLISSIIVLLVADSYLQQYTEISVLELFSNRITGVFDIMSGEEKHLAGESFTIRRDNVSATMEVWTKFPLYGCGLGLLYTIPGYEFLFSDTSISSLFAETGLFGSTAFILFFAVLFVITFEYLRKHQFINGLTDSERRLIRLTFYLMILLFEFNFISGNLYVNFLTWNHLALILSMIAVLHVKKGEYYIFKFNQRPLKQYFSIGSGSINQLKGSDA